MTAVLKTRRQTEHDERVEVIAQDVRACHAHELPDDLADATAGQWVKRNGHYLRWERYVTGGVFIGLGVTAAFVGNGRK
jgi:hypothetical protein